MTKAKAQTHYDNLKVARDAPLEVIRAAYRTLSQKYHPDKNPGDPRAARIMSVINQAYAVLSDPERRKQHDEWIRSRETSEAPRAKERPAPPPRTEEIRLPPRGCVAFADLSPSTQQRMRERSWGTASDQSHIPLASIGFSNYFWGGLGLAWFFLLFQLATTKQWDASNWNGFMGISAFAAVFVAHNARAIWAWHCKPMRPALIATRLFVIKMSEDHVWFWPLHEAREFTATRQYENGQFVSTSARCSLGGQAHTFTCRSESAYAEFVGTIEANLQSIRRADQRYIDAHNEFSKAPHTVATGTLARTLGLWVLASAAAFGVASIARDNNKRIAPMQDGHYDARGSQPAQATPYVASGSAQGSAGTDYIVQALGGREPPSIAGYVTGQPMGNFGGLSSVTVDNTQNDADVLVKLVQAWGANFVPVRVFFIPAHGRFTAYGVTPGRYDVRYLERWSGAMAKSEPFFLEEIPTPDGTQYSELSLTLYKVANGNMRTTPIGPGEF